MKKILSIAAVALTCGLSFAAPRSEGNPPSVGNGLPPRIGTRQSVGNQGQGGRVAGRRTSAGRTRTDQAADREMSAADQKLQESIEAADSLSELMQLSQRVQASSSVEVRQAMVDALDGQSKDAANLLAVYIGDRDAEVASSAFSAWASKLEDMNSSRRIQAIQAAAQTLQQGGRAHAGGMQAHGQNLPDNGPQTHRARNR